MVRDEAMHSVVDQIFDRLEAVDTTAGQLLVGGIKKVSQERRMARQGGMRTVSPVLGSHAQAATHMKVESAVNSISRVLMCDERLKDIYDRGYIDGRGEPKEGLGSEGAKEVVAREVLRLNTLRSGAMTKLRGVYSDSDEVGPPFDLKREVGRVRQADVDSLMAQMAVGDPL
jgi:hypothetical protein